MMKDNDENKFKWFAYSNLEFIFLPILHSLFISTTFWLCWSNSIDYGVIKLADPSSESIISRKADNFELRMFSS